MVATMQSLQQECETLDTLLADTSCDRRWAFDYHCGGVEVETSNGDVYVDIIDGDKDTLTLCYPLTDEPDERGEAVLQAHKILLEQLGRCRNTVSQMCDNGAQMTSQAKQNISIMNMNPLTKVVGVAAVGLAAICKFPELMRKVIKVPEYLERESRIIHAYEYSRRAICTGQRCYGRLSAIAGWTAEASLMRETLDEIDQTYADLIQRSHRSLAHNMGWKVAPAMFKKYTVCTMVPLTEFEIELEDEATA